MKNRLNNSMKKKMGIIRPVRPSDALRWAQMRNDLWEVGEQHHSKVIRGFFAGEYHNILQVFVGESQGKLWGFVELNIRNHAEGTNATAIPFIEAIFVDPNIRGNQLGSALVQRAEKWALDLGYRELGSDTLHWNQDSINFHENMGFKKVNQTVSFLRELSPDMVLENLSKTTELEKSLQVKPPRTLIAKIQKKRKESPEPAL